MPTFKKDHWEMDPGSAQCAGGRYASEFDTNAEYKKSEDSLANYVKSHRSKH